jgi:hypothetical protein
VLLVRRTRCAASVRGFPRRDGQSRDVYRGPTRGYSSRSEGCPEEPDAGSTRTLLVILIAVAVVGGILVSILLWLIPVAALMGLVVGMLPPRGVGGPENSAGSAPTMSLPEPGELTP